MDEFGRFNISFPSISKVRADAILQMIQKLPDIGEIEFAFYSDEED